ncbi:hypothetical protein EC835_109173 [Providencia alcalifaciens]|uniref:Uncharacterized protein n=1 Tax=Providencia alcalifaciens TaxID=126385 RepID=A0A4R3NFA3_9GAMM|nr:hypothetical protein EC835_109173 [Providencia alcalifaciens]
MYIKIYADHFNIFFYMYLQTLIKYEREYNKMFHYYGVILNKAMFFIIVITLFSGIKFH